MKCVCICVYVCVCMRAQMGAICKNLRLMFGGRIESALDVLGKGDSIGGLLGAEKAIKKGKEMKGKERKGKRQNQTKPKQTNKQTQPNRVKIPPLNLCKQGKKPKTCPIPGSRGVLGYHD